MVVMVDMVITVKVWTKAIVSNVTIMLLSQFSVTLIFKWAGTFTHYKHGAFTIDTAHGISTLMRFLPTIPVSIQ